MRRDELLWKLVRTVVVRAAGDHHVHPVRVVKGHHEVIGRGLAGGVGAARGDGGGLFERAGRSQRAVDLVGGDLQEPPDAGGARRLQQAQRAPDGGLPTGSSRDDASIHVTLGGEIHHGVDGVTAAELEDRRAFANVGPHEDVPAVTFQIAQVLEVARARRSARRRSPRDRWAACGVRAARTQRSSMAKPAPPVTSKFKGRSLG